MKTRLLRNRRPPRPAFRPLLEPLEARRLLATLTVTTTADEVAVNPAAGTGLAADGQVSLRSAIQTANAIPGADTINVPAGTYTLTIAGTGEDAAATGDLDITDNLTITGAGADSTIIDGGGLDNVFQAIGAITVNFSGITIRDAGPKSGAAGTGTGILADQSTVNVTACALTDNPAGGITEKTGTVTVAGSTFSGNSANCIDSLSGNVSVTGSTFSNNFDGITTEGTVTANNCTFSGNSIAGFDGIKDATANNCTFNNNGIDGIDGARDLTITNCTFSNNGNAGIDGARDLTITNCTFINNGNDGIDGARDLTIGNSTFSRNKGDGINGANMVMVVGSTFSDNNRAGIDGATTLTITNSTLSGNTYGIDGGNGTLSFCTIADNELFGITAGSVTIGNSILSAPAGGQNCSSGTTLTSSGHNLSSDGSCAAAFTQPGDRNNTDALLGPLADNGGPTQTMALLPGSPAIDAASGVGAPATDQRGVPRPQGAGFDIGAFEFQGTNTRIPDLALSGAAPAALTLGSSVTYTLTVANKGTAGATGVTLTDTLPAGVTFVSATAGTKPVNGVLMFALGDLAAGAASKVTIVVTPTTAGQLKDVATVGMDQTDPNPVNNSVTLSTTVTPQGSTPSTSPSPTGAPSPTASPTPSPTIRSVHRFGFHSLPTSIVLFFDRALDPARAVDLNNYRLVDLAGTRRPVRLRSAVYSSADRTVTLRPMHRLYLYDHYRLTVPSPGSMAVNGAAVSSGDGGPTGGDLVATITPADLILTPAQRRDGPLMALIRSLAVRFPALAHLVGGTAPRPGT
jgi:uncharacterized repeat protein (TIGR01451 family)